MGWTCGGTLKVTLEGITSRWLLFIWSNMIGIEFLTGEKGWKLLGRFGFWVYAIGGPTIYPDSIIFGTYWVLDPSILLIRDPWGVNCYWLWRI